MERLDRDFFTLDVLEVARRLPGMEIVLRQGAEFKRYMITETEAYNGSEDKACHASRGKTSRNEIMFHAGGYLYLYFIYGMYWMLNIVTGAEGDPQAVLIRGAGEISGPGRVTRCLGIDRTFNREDIVTSERIWIETNGYSPELITGPRVGIDYAGEPWVSMPWRFMIKK